MATLPTSNLNLDPVLITENEPSLTWYCDKASGRIQGTCDGYEAVRQAVDIILNTERFKWQIYEPSSGTDYSGLIGVDPGYVSVELRRRIEDALKMDSRVLGVQNYETVADGDVLNVSFTVATVFGTISEELEVNL